MTHSPFSSMWAQLLGRPDAARRRAPRRTLTQGRLGIQYSPIAARDARRIGLEQQRDAEHRGVERQLARVVRDDEHAARRDALDAGGLDAEVVAVEQHERQRARAATTRGLMP